VKFISSMTSFFKINYKTSYLLLVILFIGIFLRVYGLSEQTYWFDEVITLEVVEGSLDSIMSGSRPPLYLVLIQFWIENFGTSEFATRLLSVIFGVSSIVLIYIVGRSFFNREVGILSAFFMSVSKFQIYYSQELRYYSLYELFTLISFFFYYRFLNSKSYIYALVYIISTILVFYSHDFAVFIIAAQNLYVLIKIKELRPIIFKWITSQFLIFLGIAPRLIRSFIDKVIGESGPSWIPASDILSPLYTIVAYMGLRRVHGSIVGYIAVLFLLICVVTYFFIIGKEKWMESLNILVRGFKRSCIIKNETILVILWFLVPIALALIMSEIFKPMYHNRYLICSAPAFYILVALIMTKLKKIIPIAIILIAYIFLISPGLYNYHTKPVREDWREVGSYIKKNDTSRTSLVLISYFHLKSFNWYNKGHYKYCKLPKGNIALNELFRLCKLDDLDHFWVVRKKNERYDLSYYQHKGNLFHIVQEREFVVDRRSTKTLYLFEKVK